MENDRRYDEDEVAEIMRRATSTEASPASLPAARGPGLTLGELQEIGAEVGIPAASIAEAARIVASREPGYAPRMFLGAPRSVSRTVRIERALDDEEWSRLVADLRETFGAVGRVREHGALRTWFNGNLQVHVEPEGDHYRVRMRTLKGDATPLSGMSAVFLFVAALMVVVSALTEGTGSSAMAIAAALGAAGVGQLGWIRATLPRWAAERAAQMEGLAERIPLLLEK